MKKGKEVIIGIVFLLLVPLAFSIDTDNTGWWLNPNETLSIGVYYDDDLCRSITNTHASKVLFVPTKNIPQKILLKLVEESLINSTR